MLESIDHVNLVVTDLDGMARFYGEVLGFRQTRRVTIRGPWIEAVVGLKDVDADVIYLDLPSGPRIELIRYNRPHGVRLRGLDLPNTHGLRHVAFRVTGIDELVRRLRAAGVEFVGDVQQVPDAQVTYASSVTKRLVYCRDPEGNLLELCEYRPG